MCVTSVIQYKADEESLESLYEKESFSGHLRLLDLSRTIIADNRFSNGEDTGSVELSNGRTEATFTECHCRYKTTVGGFGADGGSYIIVDKSEIRCTCHEVTELQGEGDGGGGPDFTPGQPIDFGPNDSAPGSGGSSSGGRRSGDPDGIESGEGEGDKVGVINRCGRGSEKVNGVCVPECDEGLLRDGSGVCVSEAVAVFDEITDTFSTKRDLSDVQESKLKTVFNQLYGLEEHKKFITKLRSRVKIKYRINPRQTTPGGYDPRNKSISFRSEDDINYYVLVEELFHAYQDYQVGLGKYVYSLDKKGMTNFEFEAKLYADLVNLKHLDYVTSVDPRLQMLGGSSQGYLDWISEITDNHFNYPNWDKMKGKYFQFLDKFEKGSPAYNAPIDFDLPPKTIFDVLL